MTDYKVAVKTALKKYLNKKDGKVNRANLCEALNISDSTIDRWLSLNDSNTPKTEVLPIICKTLGITYYELFGQDIPEDIKKTLLELNA